MGVSIISFPSIWKRSLQSSYWKFLSSRIRIALEPGVNISDCHLRKTCWQQYYLQAATATFYLNMAFSSTIWLDIVLCATLVSAQDSQETPAQLAAAAFDNSIFSKYILILLAGLVVALGIYRIVLHSVRYIRTLTCLNNDTQHYFKDPNEIYAIFKQNLLYAPLFRKRHGREIRIGPMNFGILPTRFQSLVLAGIITMNIVFCTYGIEWQGKRSAVLEHLRNRTGTLSIVNMIPLVVLAGRNNPLIWLLGIPFDVFNLVHRWFGRIVMAQAVIHSLAYSINMVDQCKPSIAPTCKVQPLTCLSRMESFHFLSC